MYMYLFGDLENYYMSMSQKSNQLDIAVLVLLKLNQYRVQISKTVNISLVTLICASLVEICLKNHVIMQTRSNADTVADAEADWTLTKNNMTSCPL